MKFESESASAVYANRHKIQNASIPYTLIKVHQTCHYLALQSSMAYLQNFSPLIMAAVFLNPVTYLGFLDFQPISCVGQYCTAPCERATIRRKAATGH